MSIEKCLQGFHTLPGSNIVQNTLHIKETELETE